MRALVFLLLLTVCTAAKPYYQYNAGALTFVTECDKLILVVFVTEKQTKIVTAAAIQKNPVVKAWFQDILDMKPPTREPRLETEFGYSCA